MNRFVKALWLILGFFLLQVLVTIMVLGAPYLDLHPAYFFDSLFLNRYFWQYLFWLAAALIGLLVIGLLIIIFYPKLRQRFVLANHGGQLVLTKEAIVGLVRSKLSMTDFVEQPKIIVHITRNKIHIHIKAQLKRTSALIKQTATFCQEIQQELQQLLGTQEQVAITVNFTNYQPAPAKTKQPRVV